MIEAEFGQLQYLQNKFLYGFEDSLDYLEIKIVEVAMDCCKKLLHFRLDGMPILNN